MGDADDDRKKAAQYPKGDLLGVLYAHHARVHELLEKVGSSSGNKRKQLFVELTTLLKAHEEAEESVVRPVTSETAGPDVAEARNDEEKEADEVVAQLEKLDVDSADFDEMFSEFKQSVTDHAEAEEDEEFPTVESQRSPKERKELGEQFLATFHAAGGVD